MEKLKENRIVMIGDHGHASAVSMRGVISVLDAWADAMEEGKNSGVLPHALYFVIEHNNIRDEEVRNRFFESGNLMEILLDEYFIGTFTNATFEYFSDLMDIALRIKALNSGRTEPDRIFFDVVCPKMVIDPVGWTIEKRNKWFLEERDLYASARVIELLEKIRCQGNRVLRQRSYGKEPGAQAGRRPRRLLYGTLSERTLYKRRQRFLHRPAGA
jgi:hypothetical protein